jgi:hypothetical protein
MMNKMSYFNNKNIAIWAIVILVILNITALSFLFVNRPDNITKYEQQERETRHNRVRNFMRDDLQLNDTQLNVLQKEGEQYYLETRNYNKEIHNYKRLLYRELFNEEGIDSLRIKAFIDSIALKHGDIEMAKFEHFNRIKGICNPDQVQKFDELMDEIVNAMERKHHYKDQRHKQRGNNKGRRGERTRDRHN